MQNEDNYWKKKHRSQTSTKSDTDSTDVSDRNRQKLRFPEISKTKQAVSL